MDNWESKLGDFIESRLNCFFKWGQHDCALFACDAIEVITGIDVAVCFRHKYSTKDGAYQMLSEFSNGGLEETAELITNEFDMKEIPRNYCGRGDVVLCNVPTVINEELPTLGIVGLTEKIYIAGTRNLQIFDKSHGVRFWRV